MADNSWLKYENAGATRSQPLSPQLVEALGQFLPELGVSAEVFSGGQPSSGPNRTGTHRHDHGNAGDMFFRQGDRRLDWRNKADLPMLEQIVAKGRAAGITGWGAGDGYMQPGSMHVGFGSPSVWGAGGHGANAPDWLRAAYNGAPAGSPPAPQPQPAPQPALPPVMDGLKGAEMMNAAGYSTRPQGPVEAAGGGAGSDPRGILTQLLSGASARPGGPVEAAGGGAGSEAGAGAAAPVGAPAADTWWQKLGK
ncbi:MAG TPA: hypothetical protein VGR74_11010, partial [Actinomycetota bacterium]|nr:hypothetical protein [Actinomycetota bacterium]